MRMNGASWKAHAGRDGFSIVVLGVISAATARVTSGAEAPRLSESDVAAEAATPWRKKLRGVWSCRPLEKTNPVIRLSASGDEYVTLLERWIRQKFSMG